MNWKRFLAHKKLTTEFIITIIFFGAIIFILTNFLNYVEDRQGIVLNDAVLNLFKPINLTWLIFGLIYLSLVLAIIDLTKEPERLLLAIQSYTLLIVVRIASMYVMPLNPPQNMITLTDPFVQLFETGKTLTKDLFFSGHTATLFLLYLVTKNKKLRLLFLIFTIAVGISVLLQHVHYTADVLIAPFASYGCFSIIKNLRNKLIHSL